MVRMKRGNVAVLALAVLPRALLFGCVSKPVVSHADVQSASLEGGITL